MKTILPSDELGPIPVVDSPKKVLKEKWRNRERVLVFCSRGASFRDRHLMADLKSLLPHSKGESKFDKREKTSAINEICEMENCSKCLYFENRKRRDLYLWISNINGGPSAKFLVHNVHTMGELKLTGNCLKGSRPILSFDRRFGEEPHLELLQELLTQTFGTPAYHPKSQPFTDHVIAFSIEDGKIWFRNYQILDEASGKLEEVGPRLVLEIVKIFDGSFGGPVLYENANYTSPNLVRRHQRLASAGKYVDRVQAKAALAVQRDQEKLTIKTDPTDDVFETNAGRKRKRPSDNVEEEENDEAESDDEQRQAKTALVKKLKRKIESALPQSKRSKRMRQKRKKNKKTVPNA